MARIVRSRNGFLNCPSCYLARVQGISTGLPDIEWDRELFAGGGHVMQSRPWMAVQQALGDRVVHQSGVGWRWAGVHHRRRGVSYLYLPYGPALEDSARLGDALDAIRAAGRSLSVDFVRVEPDLVVASAAIAAAAAEPGDAAGRFPDPAVARAGVATDRRLAVVAAETEVALAARGAVRVRSVQPRHTLVLDLHRSEEELRGEMLSGRRRSINAATRKGISIQRTREAVEVEEFIRLIHRTGERNRFDPHTDEYYQTVCTTLFGLGAASLYLAKAGGESVAGVIAFESATTGYYAHAADDPERSRQIVAAAPLAWQIVRDCRAEGRTAFDFWGVIPDDSADHPWAGFSRFKKTFGGRMITRPGTFDLPLRPLRYRAYQAAREMRAARRAGGRPTGS
jgi:lipid II:glycine glycyltransferase (peptidoglycan interpeptide bridge formation enzyme)